MEISDLIDNIYVYTCIWIGVVHCDPPSESSGLEE